MKFFCRWAHNYVPDYDKFGDMYVATVRCKRCRKPLPSRLKEELLSFLLKLGVHR